MGTEERIGIAVGLAAGLTVGLLVVVLLFKKHILDCTFDERQERARGVAFKYGFFALMFAVILYGLLDMTLGRWCDAMAGGVLCICAGVLVFAVTCVVKDAYLSLREKPRYVMTLFAVMSAVNIVLGAVHILDGDMVEDGVLTFRCTNLAVGIMTTVVLAVYIVNLLLSRRDEEAE